MKNFVKKLMAGILCAAMFTLTACSGGGEGKDGDSKENEKGRYLETKYTLPEEALNAMTIGKLTDGTLRMVTDTSILDSADGGVTWEPSGLEYTLVVQREDGSYLNGAAVDSKGRLFLAYSNKCYLVDENGTEKELAVELPELSSQFTFSDDEEEFVNALTGVQFTTDDKVVGKDYNGNVYLIDADSGEIIKTFGEDDSYTHSYAVVGNRLLTLGFEGIDIYNIETGALEKPDSALSEYFNNLADDENRSMSSSSLVAAEAEDTFFYADATGMYRYTFGAGEMEKLINGSLCSLANPGLSLINLLEMENNTFLMMYHDVQGALLMHYEYSEEASAVPSEEIKVYALEDNQTIRQTISNFQAKNPDYYVNLEVGMSGDDSVTVSDALSTLNTNIMAGNGPDVILLDKLPIDSYIEKGLLEDLTDVVSECQKNSSYYENILNYKQNDEGLYAIATRFALPLITGTDETLQMVSDLATLKDEVSRLRAEDADIDSVLGQETADSLIQLLLTTSLPEIVKEDGTLDSEKLTRFLEAAKEIYKANYQPTGEGDSISFSGMSAEVSKNMLQILKKQQKMNLINADSVSSMDMLVSMNDQAGWGFQTLSGLSEHVFVPQDTVGISTKSENKETAKEFVKYLLSSENQSSTQTYGFPVNTDALDQVYDSLKNQDKGEFAISMESDEGEGDLATMNMRSVSEEEFNTLKGYIEVADTAAVSDAVITEAIAKEGGTCLTDDTDISACVDKILQSVNLYLAE